MWNIVWRRRAPSIEAPEEKYETKIEFSAPANNELVSRDATAKEERVHRCWLDFRRHLLSYSQVTEIHGVRYIIEPRSTCEKLFWFMIIVLSAAASCFMFIFVYREYKHHPIIVSFASKSSPIYTLPFPAVTICPETQNDKSLFDLTANTIKLYNRQSITDEEWKIYQYLTSVCHHTNISLLSEDYRNKALPSYDNDFYYTMLKLAPTLDDIFHECHSEGRKLNCSNIFKTVITEKGICYTHNMIPTREMFKPSVYFYDRIYKDDNSTKLHWNLEQGYKNWAGLETVPRRALLAGAGEGLTIKLSLPDKFQDNACGRQMTGFRVLLHSPADIPRPSFDYLRLPLNKMLSVALAPFHLSTKPKVESYPVNKRNCYMINEFPLRYHESYSQHHCFLECFNNYTLNRCGCVSFAATRDIYTDICGSIRDNCTGRATFVKENEMLNQNGSFNDCKCLPLCTELRYLKETSQIEWKWKEHYSHKHRSSQLDVNKTIGMSMLEIYFKSASFLELQRGEVYGIYDLLASFGGLLSLFTGFSLITLVELIYFFSLRIACNKYMYGLWPGPRGKRITRR